MDTAARSISFDVQDTSPIPGDAYPVTSKARRRAHPPAKHLLAKRTLDPQRGHAASRRKVGGAARLLAGNPRHRNKVVVGPARSMKPDVRAGAHPKRQCDHCAVRRTGMCNAFAD